MHDRKPALTLIWGCKMSNTASRKLQLQGICVLGRLVSLHSMSCLRSMLQLGRASNAPRHSVSSWFSLQLRIPTFFVYRSRNIVARGETIVTQLKMEGAMDARDALAKATYAGMLAQG